MSGDFFDTNVLLYVVSNDAAKADRAEALVRQGGGISVQVLNEATNVMRRKLRLRLVKDTRIPRAVARATDRCACHGGDTRTGIRLRRTLRVLDVRCDDRGGGDAERM